MVHSQSSNIPLLCQGCWNLPLKLAQPAKNKAILWWNTVQCKSAKQIKMNAFFKLAANSCMLVCVTQWRGLWTTGLCCNQTPGKNGNQLCLAIPKEKRRIRFFFFLLVWSVFTGVSTRLQYSWFTKTIKPHILFSEFWEFFFVLRTGNSCPFSIFKRSALLMYSYNNTKYNQTMIYWKRSVTITAYYSCTCTLASHHLK